MLRMWRVNSTTRVAVWETWGRCRRTATASRQTWEARTSSDERNQETPHRRLSLRRASICSRGRSTLCRLPFLRRLPPSVRFGVHPIHGISRECRALQWRDAPVQSSSAVAARPTPRPAIYSLNTRREARIAASICPIARSRKPPANALSSSRAISERALFRNCNAS